MAKQLNFLKHHCNDNYYNYFYSAKTVLCIVQAIFLAPNTPPLSGRYRYLKLKIIKKLSLSFLSVWPKLTTFRANYHVLGFHLSFQQKVAKSMAFCEKPSKLVDLAKTSNFLCKLPCFWVLVMFSAKSCKKYGILWKTIKTCRFSQTNLNGNLMWRKHYSSGTTNELTLIISQAI